jgi:hypothetical protein
MAFIGQKKIIQSNGIRHGASSSPVLFDFSLADVDEEVIDEEEDVDALFFADDGAI